MGGPAGTSISHCDAGTGGSTPRPSTRLGRRLGGDPLLLFLDELPPYLEYAVAVPVGSGDLGIVTTAALGKLFVGTGRSDLKVEPLHAPAVVFETADADPTPASSPVPTPARFEATALRYRLLAHDPADLTRLSPVNASTATVRLKQKLHNRDDRYELELLAMPKTNGLSIRYTTDGSAPTTVGATRYSGIFRVPVGSRVVCAISAANAFNLNSEIVRIPIPQPGNTGPKLDAQAPARWTQRIKFRLPDPGATQASMSGSMNGTIFC